MSSCPPIAINTTRRSVQAPAPERLWQPYELAFYVAAFIAASSLAVAGGSITLLLTRQPAQPAIQAVAVQPVLTGSLEPVPATVAVEEPVAPPAAKSAADRYYDEWMAQIAEAEKDFPIQERADAGLPEPRP